jgi:paraquat-inducible protein A
MSIASGLATLWKNGQYGLFVLIGVFSIVFPIVKNLLLLYIVLMADWTRMSIYKTINWLERLGRWSMLDVFVVALLIIAVELRFVAHVEVHSGVHLFAASVLLTNLIAAYIYHMLKR